MAEMATTFAIALIMKMNIKEEVVIRKDLVGLSCPNAFQCGFKRCECQIRHSFIGH